MSVHPGFAEQAFIESVVEKIDGARLKRERGLSYLIEVDGGIKVTTPAGWPRPALRC